MTQDAPFIPTVLVMELSGNMGGTSPEEAVSLFSRAVSDTASGCARAGGTIGHIKANMRSSEEMVSASSTTEDGNVRLRYGLESAVDDYSIVMNAIVYCLEYRDMKVIAEKAFSVLPVNTSVWHKGGLCNDPECGDPDCKDSSHRKIIDLF
ncbi:MAG: hypothetical protein PHI62_03030 [Candidatus Methanomethylophilaceae archaeon]|nr:hypothetical protein [Candidatus Methanomethylophilaceae archaeon]